MMTSQEAFNEFLAWWERKLDRQKNQAQHNANPDMQTCFEAGWLAHQQNMGKPGTYTCQPMTYLGEVQLMATNVPCPKHQGLKAGQIVP